MRKDITKIMPEHFQYVEVFAGALWVLLYKNPSKLEIINDIHGDLINFYRIIQNREKCQELIDRLLYIPKSREVFLKYKELYRNPKPSHTDIDRATMFYYLLKLSFGGRLNWLTYVIPNDGRKNINYQKLPKEFIELHDRLQNVYIEKEDWSYILEKYDRKDGLFYLDPPYLETNKESYEDNFDYNEYVKLKNTLTQIKGKFILTCNNKDELRNLFSSFNIKDTEVHYSLSHDSDACKKYGELIVTNFK